MILFVLVFWAKVIIKIIFSMSVYKKRLTEIFQEHNPDKLPNVPDLLEVKSITRYVFFLISS